jgi:hypothetical protein
MVMEGLIEGVLAGGWPFVVGWVLPSAAFVTLFSLLVFPSITFLSVASDISRLAEGPKLATVLFVSLALAVLLNSLSTPMYRVLEGYLGWPRWIINRGIARHVSKRGQIEKELDAASRELAAASQELASVSQALATASRDLEAFELEGHSKSHQLRHKANDQILKTKLKEQKKLKAKIAASKLEQGKLAERLMRYPVSDDRVVGTRLGNAMRGLETIGSSTFKLDSQVLWGELRAAVPSVVNSELDSARANVDVFVALFYLSLVFSLTCAAVVFTTQHRAGTPRLGIGITGGVSLILLPIWYRLAVLNTRGLRSASQAMVYTGRTALASMLGLTMPTTIKEERDMWLLVSQMANYGYRQSAAEKVAADLDSFRESK